MWWRGVPSSTAPMRAIARRDGWSSASVFSSKRSIPSASNARRSIRSVASVLNTLRCQRGVIHVHDARVLGDVRGKARRAGDLAGR
jgi:hypothetical protein